MKKSSIIVTSISILIISLFLICGFASKNKCVYTQNGLDIKAGEYQKVVSEGIELKPGIYRIDIEYVCNSNQSEMYIASFTPRDSSIRENALKSTGGYLYLNKTKETQEFYLYENTHGLHLELNAYYDDFKIESIKIYNTGKQWFCLAFITLCLLAVVLNSIHIFDQIKTGTFTQEKAFCTIAFVGIWIISSLPLLCGYTILTADGPYHMERVEGVANSLRAGIFPTRLEPTWLQSYGYGNGLFYCDIFLLLPALLRIIGFSVTSSYNAYLLTVNALIILSSYCAFKKIIKKEYIAMLMTAMYSLSEIKYYQYIHKGTLGEGTALIFLPLVLLGLYEILFVECEKTEETIESDNKKKNTIKGWMWLTIGYSGLICSHILSTEITAFFTIIILLININRIFKKSVIKDFLKASGTTFLLTVWFTIPFLESYLFEDVNIKHSLSRKIQSEGLRFVQLAINFFGRMADPEANGIYSYEAVGLGIPLLLGIVLLAILLLINKNKEEKTRRKFELSILISSVIFVAFSLRIFPWDAIQSKIPLVAPLVSSIQFPRRFLELGTLLCIVVLGLVLEKLSEFDKKWIYYSLLILTMVGIVFSFVSRLDYDVATKLKYPLGNFEGIRTDYVAGGEYVLYGTDLSKLKYNEVSSSDEVICSNYSNGALSGSVYAENIGNIDGYIDFPLLNYRHYSAKDEYGNNLIIANGDNNLVRVIIPVGCSGRIIVKYLPPFYWRIAEAITILAVLIIVLSLIRKNKTDSSMRKNIDD